MLSRRLGQLWVQWANLTPALIPVPARFLNFCDQLPNNTCLYALVYVRLRLDSRTSKP